MKPRRLTWQQLPLRARWWIEDDGLDDDTHPDWPDDDEPIPLIPLEDVEPRIDSQWDERQESLW